MDLTVIVLAAGGGTRMKSKTMKVLHPIGGQHDRPRAERGRRRWSPPASWRWSGTSASRSARTSTSCVPDAVLAVQETQEGTAHAVRVAMEASPGPAPGPCVVAYGDTPLLEGESLRAFAAEHEAAGGRSASSRASWSDPSATAGSCATTGGEVEAIVEEKEATRRAARGPGDQLRHPRLRRRLPARRAAADRQRQRQGRVLPHRRDRHRPRGRADRRRVPDRRRHADRGRQRPGPAGRARRRAEPPHRRPAGCATGVTVMDPAHHLDRRRRGAGARRDDPARRPAARRDRGRRGRRHRPGHARSRTARSAPAPAWCAPTASSP